MTPPDPLGGGELLGGGLPDRVEGPEVLRERAGRGGADVPDRQRDEHPPQRLLLGGAEVVDQPLPVGRQHAAVADRVLGSVFLAARVKSGTRAMSSAVRSNRSPSSVTTPASSSAIAPS